AQVLHEAVLARAVPDQLPVPDHRLQALLERPLVLLVVDVEPACERLALQRRADALHHSQDLVPARNRVLVAPGLGRVSLRAAAHGVAAAPRRGLSGPSSRWWCTDWNIMARHSTRIIGAARGVPARRRRLTVSRALDTFPGRAEVAELV